MFRMTFPTILSSFYAVFGGKDSTNVPQYLQNYDHEHIQVSHNLLRGFEYAFLNIQYDPKNTESAISFEGETTT